MKVSLLTYIKSAKHLKMFILLVYELNFLTFSIEPIEEEPCQTLETDQTADPLPIVTDGISEAIEEVQTHSPLLVEIKKETIEEKEELTNDLAKSGETTEDVPGS